MNRETFLNELMAGLTQLGPVEQRQVADYYNELIFDGVENGKPEEEIIAGFGAPEEIAAQIRAEYKSQQAVEGAPGQGAVPPRPACLEYPAQEPVHTVVVDARNVRVNVRAVPGGGVRVLFQPRENDRVTVAEKDGAFLFTHTMSIFNVWNWLDLLRGPHDITLELPLDFAGEVCVKTCNAGITVSGLSAGGKGRFVTSNARITVENCVFGSLAAKTSNGPITLSGVTGGDCEAASNNARITAEHCRFAEKLWMQTSRTSRSKQPTPPLRERSWGICGITPSAAAPAMRRTTCPWIVPMRTRPSVCGPPPATAASTCASCSTAVPRTGPDHSTKQRVLA